MNNSDKWTLEFTPSIKDCQDFMVYYLENSPKLRKKYLVEGLIAGCIVLFSVFSCIYIVGDINPFKRTELTSEYLISLGILAFILGLAIFILYPEGRKKQVIKNLEKLCLEDGDHTPRRCIYSFTESEIRATSEIAEAVLRWEAIDKITVNGEYVYLDQGRMNPIIIPKRAFEDDEYQNEFIEYIKRIHAAVSSKAEKL